MKLFRKLMSLTLALMLVCSTALPAGTTALAAEGETDIYHQIRSSVKSISIKDLPTVTEYTAGQQLSLDGLVVKLQYDGEGTMFFTPNEFADKDITVTPSEGTVLTTEGKNTVTVAYGDLTDTFEVNVTAPVSDEKVSDITINTQPTVTEYTAGQKLSLEGLTVKLHYSTGNSNIFTPDEFADKDITVTPAEGTVLTTEGKNTVTVAYGDLTDTFEVNVTAPVNDEKVSDITVNTQPTVTEYIAGQKLSLEGLTVKLHYNTGNSNIFTPDEFADKDITVTPAEGTVLTTEGKNTVTVAYGDLTDTFEVTVAPAGREINRIFGSDRYETALAISSKGWNEADSVIIASGKDFADALAGAALSKALNAPVLLVSGGDDSHVFAEIDRLGAEKAFILGGENAVSASVENKLTAKEIEVKRLSGSDRYATAAAIAAEMNKHNTEADKAFVVSGESFADALSAGYAAAMTGSPILYTNADHLNDTTAAYISENGISEVTIIGGEAAVSAEAAQQLEQLTRINRIGGEDRYLTSLAVARNFFDATGKDQIAVATGKNFPDALTGGAYAISLGVPVLLVGDEADAEMLKYLDDCGISRVIIFGGENALSADIAEALK